MPDTSFICSSADSISTTRFLALSALSRKYLSIPRPMSMPFFINGNVETIMATAQGFILDMAIAGNPYFSQNASSRWRVSGLTWFQSVSSPAYIPV